MMRIGFLDWLVACMALLSGLSISAVAVWYSVAGLVSIFAAAALPITIMGVVLESGKLVATVWLKQNWSIAPKLIRSYLVIAVFFLMAITSMGIFGYLSKAHIDQGVPTGDVAARITAIDEKIKVQEDAMNMSRTVLRQLDDAVNQALGRGAAVNLPANATPAQIQAAQQVAERNTNQAATLRRNQQQERNNQLAAINRSQEEIQKLRNERIPLASQLRQVEAEVGPIKYIAALIYGDNPDTNTLERAVRYVIILIVIIFDPLAVVLLLASQHSFQQFREIRFRREEQNKKETSTEIVTPIIEQPVVVPIVPVAETKIETTPVTINQAAAPVEETVAEQTVIEETPAQTESTTVVEIPAPQGTPNEVWTAPITNTAITSNTDDNDLDKIYKEATATEARRRRSRGWLQGGFPKKDD